MGNRVMSMAEAELSGFPMEAYDWNFLLEGEWVGTLDAKVWGKSCDLFCYFTAEDGAKIRLSAYKAKKGPGQGEWYTPQDGMLELREVFTGQKFALATSKNRNERMRWDGAKLLTP